jgi:VWFA-related protein
MSGRKLIVESSRELKRLFIIALCFSLLFCCAASYGQEKPKTTPSNSQPPIQSHVNVVLVPVVVRDSEGHAVETLKKGDFRIFDDGEERPIAGFSVETRGGETAINASGSASSPSGPGAVQQANAPLRRFVALMFDDMHLSAGALVHAQQAATKMLQERPSGADMFAVLTTSGSNSGLTRDRSVLERAIMNVKAHTASTQNTIECPKVDYYEANLIVNENDQAALNHATQNAMACASATPGMAKQMAVSAARRALTLGDEDATLTMRFVSRIVRGMGRLPGQSLLVLISSGFPAVTHNDMTLTSEVLDAAAQSNVTIDTLDARGLYTDVLDAGDSGGGALETHLSVQYRQAAALASEDLLSALADGTGGAFSHDNNDLESGLTKLLSNLERVYLLQFSLKDVKRDGTYHRLTVKVDQPHLKVQARRGYFAPPVKN